MNSMLITTQDELSDYQITKTLGLVKGNTIRARHIGKDILAALRSMVGGEILEYTKMISESREQALDRMIEQAQEMGADGIVCVRYTTTAVLSGAAEMFVYGTAVKLDKNSDT